MSGEGNEGMIGIVSVVGMESECVSVDMNMRDCEIGDVWRGDEEVVNDLRGEEIVGVMVDEIMCDEVDGGVGYEMCGFVVGGVDRLERLSWVVGYIGGREEIRGESVSGGKIVVGGEECIIGVDENVVEEVGKIKCVGLV